MLCVGWVMTVEGWRLPLIIWGRSGLGRDKKPPLSTSNCFYRKGIMESCD